MAVDSKHPLFLEFDEDWQTMRDTHRGERVVKQEGIKYLPPTSGMVADGMSDADAPGFRAYASYRMRAHFPDMVAEAVEAMLGVMHHKPPVIELPTAMEPMREKATVRNESLEMLLRRINEQQLISGRCGVLVDLPAIIAAGAPPMPYLALYEAQRILNWDQGRRDGIAVDNLNFVSLDESEFERQANFEWEYQHKYRVLILGDPTENEPSGEGTYRVGVFRDQNNQFSDAALTEPSLRGNTLDRIPFTFINSRDVVADPDDPPLLGLAKLALTIYRGEADYRQSLFMQGQDTLVTIGMTGQDGEELRIGSGGRIDLPSGAGNDAKFIGVESGGLSEQREALQNDYQRAAQKGGQLMDTVSRQKESGDALKIRVAARTATLNQIAITGAYGLQTALRHAAQWMGADPEQVVVTPNLDFVDDSFQPDDLVKLLTARSLGAPLSLKTIHDWLREKDLSALEFEEELAQMEEEDRLAIGSSNDDLPDEEDENDDGDGDEAGTDE